MMKDNAKLWSRAGVVLTVLGLAAALMLQTAFTWGLIEATKFEPDDPALFVSSENLKSLQCPLIVTSDEVGVVRATFNNPEDRERIRRVRANISHGFISLPRQVNTELPLAPGETQTLTWEVTTDDAVWNRLIFVRIFALRASPDMPAMTATCSILTLNWPVVPGRLLANLLLAISIMGPMLGLGLWFTMNRPLAPRQRYQFRLASVLTAVILIGLFVSLAKLWALSALILTIILIVLVSLAMEWLYKIDEPKGRPQ
jgi:hypothetical protein